MRPRALRRSFLPRQRSNGRWLAGYLIRILAGIVIALIAWQFLPGLIGSLLAP